MDHEIKMIHRTDKVNIFVSNMCIDQILSFGKYRDRYIIPVEKAVDSDPGGNHFEDTDE